MAFNPFTSFRKYQKFWMATILLLCMITFVLCTGVGGDLSDRLIYMFRGRQGEPLAKLNGSNIYRDDLEKVRARRNIADLFMRNASRLAQKQIQDFLKDPSRQAKISDERKRKELTLQLSAINKDLTDRLKQPRYFEGGVKLEELLDFMLWLQQADRLGIRLDDASVNKLVFDAVHGHDTGFDQRMSWQAEAQVRNNIYSATPDVITRALRDEFRVQIAQLALMGSRPELILNPSSSIRPVSLPMQIRKAIPPEQIWRDYEKERSEFDVTLVPVPVDDFLKDIPAPTEAQLQDYYQKYRDNDFNPTTDQPSFRFPPRMKVQWVSADPESPFYRQLAQAVTAQEITPAVAWTPMLSAQLAAVRYASQSAAWDASLQVNYDFLKRQQSNFSRYQGPPLTDPNFALFLANTMDHEKTPPASVAALVGAAGQCIPLTPATFAEALAVPVGYQADVWLRHEKELGPVLAAESKRRWPLGASMVLSGAASRLLPAAQWYYASEEPQFLPLALVRDELRKKIEVNLAHGWVAENMAKVRHELSLPGTPGNANAVQLRLDQVKQRYGLEVKATDQFHNRYDIAKAPSLQPLLKSFEKYRTDINVIEGRAGTEQQLKEDDFWRLFFDSSIPFSVENAGPYVAKPWPPDVKKREDPLAPLEATVGEGQTIPLFKMALRPFLFWQTKFEPGRTPESLAEVREKVEYAWKHDKTRTEKALPLAKAIAQALQEAGKNPKDLQIALSEEARKLKRDVITLRGVAPLVPKRTDSPMAPQTYEPYQLPRDTFVYPRTDMVKELLKLNDLTEKSKDGIKTGNKELDDLNQELLKRKLPGKQVQVLTNQPRSYYYVAVVTSAPDPSRFQFIITYRRAVGQFPSADEFVDRYQVDAGKEYRKALTQQLRDAAEREIMQGAAASFDASAGSG